MDKSSYDQFSVKWHDKRSEPTVAPNPAYPNGIDLDVSHSAKITCTVHIPYPSKRCGFYKIICKICDNAAIISTAGRPDDPKSIKFGCKIKENNMQ